MQPDNVVTIDRAAARLKRMRQSVLTAARLLRDCSTFGGFRGRWAFLTLTYRPGVEWEALHITALLKAMREFLRRRGVAARYVWVMELTRAGAPHYHVAVWLPKGMTLPKPDKRGWWPHGSTRIEWAKHVIGYLAKYVSKGTEGAKFPPSARINGAGGLDGLQRMERRWWLMPSYIREQVSVSDDVRRRPGGGFLCRATGELLASAWALVAVGRQTIRIVPRATQQQGLPVPPSLRPAWRRSFEASNALLPTPAR